MTGPENFSRAVRIAKTETELVARACDLWKNGTLIRDIAKILGVKFDRVRNIVRRFDRRTCRTSPEQIKQIRELYAAGKTVHEIVDITGCSWGAVECHCYRRGLAPKSLSTGMKPTEAENRAFNEACRKWRPDDATISGGMYGHYT